ncbi:MULTISPECIES: GspH/FimT family pseudopilin [unclassified Oleiphilus]|uniref:GspH/FimT family pseudopilin n=4 Tax=Oleiphilus TaxID=141450 RepID=UPI0007C32F94|nr:MULTISPECIES: GspH/FimT family pseudopilin [unclassified Oleiphilus]KZY43536.1 hypothetical protein A3732_14135 [Oleiphilus sp. HI0050]KZY79859.1 hypothetical protein A3741_00795 [Oleiphilus sp. HI0069]KZY82095.1 hypothetical protein A3740_05820 [Oleiphilus sp. HI0068]KZZ08691.1 hypothetical protein A3749_01895 [Oleiphilus sp. HI0078]KZZ29998.1 hypothetical protein A3752_02840 [Oleiphilus sp. HI0081]KZZ39170.1 hypothetical protein A3755_25910 [Oleiphilus sp. HI0085]
MPPSVMHRCNKYHQEQKSRQSGITLVELLTCLAIVSILTFVVIPSFNDIFQNARSDSNINHLSQFIRHAKREALARQTRITLCPSSSGLQCEQGWQAGAMIFIDEDKDQKRDESELLLQLKTPFIPSGTISFNNPTNRVVFSRLGFPLGSAGSYIYCPENNDEKYARALIINFQGRLRIGRDSNSDDIVEASGGKNVSCG